MIQPGMILGDRYEIIELIGTGGMADVYKAKDHKLNRHVAVKVLKQEFAENTEFVRKFRTEAQAAAGLMHPNIVNVYDVEQPYKGEVYHFDCYRLKDISEAMDFGAEEYLYSGNYCFIEWPEMIEALLPEDTVYIKIVPQENGDRQLILDSARA